MVQVHILYNGNTEDINLEDLIPVADRPGLGLDDNHELTASELNGDQIKRALANHYDKPLEEFNELQVDIHKSGDITIRPDAVFGT